MAANKRFTNEQIIRILKEADSGVLPMAELARKHGVSEWTLCRWRRSFGGLEPKEATRVRELERENLRLKKLLAERDLELEVLKEIQARNW